MEWTFLILVAVLWLVSPIILLIALIIARRQIQVLRDRLASQPEREAPPSVPISMPVGAGVVGGGSRYAPIDLENLLLLRLELQRLLDAGDLTEDRHRQLIGELDRLWERHLRNGGAQPATEVWQHRRALAWGLLAQGVENPLGPPPWLPAATKPTAPPVPVRVPPAIVPDHEQPVRPFPLPIPPAPPIPGIDPETAARVAPRLAAKPTPPPPRPVSETVVVDAADWRPAPPSPLERALRTLSGWPKLIAPFLAQNVGWFVGGFCFIAGALFLIANTSGFVNALVVFASLFGASAFLIWAGYQFRRQRAELIVASNMLLTLGMLLAPLVLTVAVRLVVAGRGDPLLLIVGLLVTAATLGAFAWAAALTSTLMDRALSGQYARLLTALGAVQLAAPLAGFAPNWQALAVLHAMLLGLLGYGLWTFSGEWLRRLFVDRRLTTYYAAGMLVYAATVSFVHLTWLWPDTLPAGYSGPFLMALCGLLFPVDAAFKEWVNKYAFLSRFSFALYGLSAVAVAVALRSTPATLLTLGMGALLYGWMTWRYRTLPPLYLLFGCVAGLYGFGLLHFVPPAWHGLAAQPGLFALLGCSRWAGSRSRAIALQCLIVLGLLLVGLTVWSLVWNSPGWLGFATAATMAGLTYFAVRSALVLPEANPRWAYADVGVVGLAAVAVAYAPGWAGSGWGVQTAYGWLALAALWAGLGLHDSRQMPVSRSVWVAGALANVALALGLAAITLWPALFGRLEPILLLALAGGLLLWLSLGLRQQILFYCVLACAAGIGVLVKQGFFPGPSTGLIEFVLVLGLWVFLWRLNWRDRIRQALLADSADRSSSISKDTSEDPRSLAALIGPPLEQAMALLWAVGLVKLGLPLLEGSISTKWPATAGLGVVTGLLLIGHFHRFRWVALPFALGLAGLLVGLDRLGFGVPWLGAAAVLYALLVWRSSVAALARPATWRLAGIMGFVVPGGAGGSRQVEESLHACALLVAAIPVAASPALALLGSSAWEMLPAILIGLLLFALAGWHYRSILHAYAALIALTVAAWLIDARWMKPELFALGQPLLNVMLSAIMALAGIGLESEKAAPLAYWRVPLRSIGTLLYLLALAGATLAGLAGDPRLPGLLALLCAALFPVARPWPNAAAWRGLGLPLLLSGLVWSLAAQADIGWRNGIELTSVWGYALWFGGNLLLPRWNARQLNWAVAPEFWPLLGLVFVLGGSVAGLITSVWSPAAALGLLAPYLFLLLRNTAWPGMAWLAVATLTVSGLLIGMDLRGWNLLSGSRDVGAVVGGYAAALVWLNLLLLLVPLWRRHGGTLTRWLGWRGHDLAEPLFRLPFAALVLLLARLGWLAFGLFWSAPMAESVSWGVVGVALLLAVTAGHAFRLRPESPQAHVLLLTMQVVAVAIGLKLALPPAGLPLTVALWDGALLLIWRYGPRLVAWRSALELWLALLPAASVALLFVVPGLRWAGVTATLFVLAAVTLVQGWWQGQSARLRLGLLLALLGGYAIWLGDAAPFASGSLRGLAPWYALQTVLLWLALEIDRPRLDAWINGWAARADEERIGRVYEFEQALRGSIPGLLVLGLLWLGWHAYAVLMYRAGWGPVPWHFGAAVDPLAAGATLLLLAGRVGMGAWRRPDQPNRVYATAVLVGLLVAYGRLVALGLAPFGVGDTAALMAAAYAVFLLRQFTGSRPLYHLALLLPLLALATVPWQLASSWTGGALLAAAVLYLSLAGGLRNPLPLYLGVLALNGAVYLWAPLWADRYGLWQLYIVPAAVSVLALLHLHRRELRPKVLSGARLAALSALYAGAGLDVFLRPELWIFVLALALALTGIVLGIALRVRAFLYAGVAFLVLNVAGQLARFYPEQGLSRALILIGLGAVITVGMVIFNLKREEIMRKIRLVRADLAAWE
ncbi:MAG TPA: hypothetical protein P5260_15090 [Candidatus Competibacter sp.]|nr:hypothetical protein [Candidatus Competibacter sp.]